MRLRVNARNGRATGEFAHRRVANILQIRDADFAGCNWWRARGLTSSRIEFLKKNFFPSTNAPAALRADFEKWLNDQKP